MKKNWMAGVSVVALTAGVGVVALAALASPAQAGNAYLALGAGFATMGDRDFEHEGIGPPRPPPSTSVFFEGEQDFSAGPAFEAAIGYDVGPLGGGGAGLRVELQATYMNFDVGGVQWSGNTSDSVPPGGRAGSLDVTLLMANALVDFDIGLNGVTPYVGVGVGFALSELDSLADSTKSTPPWVKFSDATDTSFSAQLLVGASIPVATNLDLYGNYRLLWLGEMSLNSTHDPASDVEFDDHFTHAITIGMRYNFM